jgi:hypothetical protein
MPKVEHDEQRAKEPISNCLIRYLMVPEIYWDAQWPDPHTRVDVLAIDRAGAGAVHVVEMKRSRSEALRSIPQIMAIPAQYRWVAFFGASDLEALRADMKIERLFPENGPGRIGVIVVIRLPNGDLDAKMVVRAERFSGSLRENVKQFTSSHAPDISFD